MGSKKTGHASTKSVTRQVLFSASVSDFPATFIGWQLAFRLSRFATNTRAREAELQWTLPHADGLQDLMCESQFTASAGLSIGGFSHV